MLPLLLLQTTRSLFAKSQLQPRQTFCFRKPVLENCDQVTALVLVAQSITSTRQIKTSKIPSLRLGTPKAADTTDTRAFATQKNMHLKLNILYGLGTISCEISVHFKSTGLLQQLVRTKNGALFEPPKNVCRAFAFFKTLVGLVFQGQAAHFVTLLLHFLTFCDYEDHSQLVVVEQLNFRSPGHLQVRKCPQKIPLAQLMSTKTVLVGATSRHPREDRRRALHMRDRQPRRGRVVHCPASVRHRAEARRQRCCGDATCALCAADGRCYPSEVFGYVFARISLVI